MHRCPRHVNYNCRAYDSFSPVDRRSIYCMAMLERDMCPTIKCDFFRHRQKLKVFIVKRKHVVNPRDVIIEKLERIEEILDISGK